MSEKQRKKILVLGGTIFLGRAFVEAALQAGHEVTIFNRGKSNPGIFAEVETILGDREHDLDKLTGREWDSVVDTCGYVPRVVSQSAEFLRSRVNQYIFISSLSVYADFSRKGTQEDGALSQLPDASIEDYQGEHYGALKALCEAAVQSVYGKAACILRPGLIVGPYDHSDRFTYWVERFRRGGEIIVPGRPERQVQWIDVKDLAEWMVTLVENGSSGVFNAVSPPGQFRMKDLMKACQWICQPESQVQWVSERFLLEHKIQPWIELPLWIPESDLESTGFFYFDVSSALQAGLRIRPIEDTVQAICTWLPQREQERPWKAGLDPIKEKELLNEWLNGKVN